LTELAILFSYRSHVDYLHDVLYFVPYLKHVSIIHATFPADKLLCSCCVVWIYYM